MKTVAVSAGLVTSKSSKITLWPFVVTLVFFAFLALELINHLKGEWSLNPQYGYGWSVPFLTLYLLWRRWLDRPSPQPPDSRTLPVALMILCAFVFFPIRFVAEANPDWRLLSWSFAFAVGTLSILWIFLAGGWPWVRYFAFPFVFFLVAVPWPMKFEQAVVQNLMRSVAAINVGVMDFAGIPALRHGNVIEVASGLIGIEEACSGVRSLQATLMISLFLGELYRFRIGPRLFLVVAGAILAFFWNVVRTAILVWVGAKRGTSAIEGWHDPAGLTILIACLLGLWLLSLIMMRYSSSDSAVSPFIDNQRAPHRLSWQLLLCLTIWFILAETGVQIWYGVHQSPLSSRWSVRWPDSENAYKTVPIPPEAESILRYSEGGGATWKGSDGHQKTMYFFHWLPGRTAALFVKIHRPDICLPASGLTMERDDGIRLLDVNGVNLPVRSYRFSDHGVPLHVFYCYWDARSSYENAAAAAEEDWTARGRLRAAMRGRREVGAQMLEVVVWGYEDDSEAGEVLQRELAQIVHAG